MSLTDEDVERFVEAEANKNTQRKMHSDVVLMKSFLPNENETTPRHTTVRIRRLPQQILLSEKKVGDEFEPTTLRASSYDPGNRAGSVTGMNFVVCSYGKFQPGYRDEIQETKPKWRNINKYCSRLS